MSREKIWRLLFKDEPVPKQEEGAVDELYGMLNDLKELTEILEMTR